MRLYPRTSRTGLRPGPPDVETTFYGMKRSAPGTPAALALDGQVA